MSCIWVKNIRYLVTCDDEDRMLEGVDMVIRGREIVYIGPGGSNVQHVAEAGGLGAGIKMSDKRAGSEASGLETPAREGVCADKIQRVAFTREDLESAEVIDGTHMAVYPGLVNTHHHLYQIFTRNLPATQSMELFDWLKYLYEIWKNIGCEDIRLTTLIGTGELMKTGCTTVFDHHYVFPTRLVGGSASRASSCLGTAGTLAQTAGRFGTAGTLAQTVGRFETAGTLTQTAGGLGTAETLTQAAGGLGTAGTLALPAGDFGLIDAQAQAAEEIGVRMHFSRGSMSLSKKDGGLPPDEVVQSVDEIIRDSERLIDKLQDPQRFSMSRIALAPCSPFSVTKDLLIESAKLARARKVRLHTHLCETKDEENYMLSRYGIRPLAYMEETGWIGNDVWFAHGIYFNDDELKLLADTGTGVAHCPISNMKLSSGIARIPEMLKIGVPVGLAVDGSASNDGSNLLEEMRVCYLLHRLNRCVKASAAERRTDAGGQGTDIPTDSGEQDKARRTDAGGHDTDRNAAPLKSLNAEAPTGYDILKLATRGSARLLGRDDIGCLAEGMAADLFMIDTRKLEMAGAFADPRSVLATVGYKGSVDMTIVNGRVTVRDGRLVTIDEERVSALAGEAWADLCRRS